MITIELDDGSFLVYGWEDCAIKGCPNKCCSNLNSPWCHPHTLEMQGIAETAAEESA